MSTLNNGSQDYFRIYAGRPGTTAKAFQSWLVVDNEDTMKSKFFNTVNAPARNQDLSRFAIHTLPGTLVDTSKSLSREH